MTEEEQIQVKTLEDVIEDIKGMNPEYIIEFLKEDDFSGGFDPNWY